MTEAEKFILDKLDEMKIDHQIYRHDARFTVEEKEALDKELGITARHCKNIFLTDRKKTHFYLLVMPFEKTFRTAEVSKELGSSRLSFAPEDMLLEMLNCHSGSLSTLSLLYDRDFEVSLAVDSDLLKCDALCMHPNIDTTTVTMKLEDYLGKFLPKIKHRPTFVTVTVQNT